MVDWDRVDELRSAGQGWGDIAADPKVGFHPDASAGDPGRALRALYHIEKSRRARQGPAPSGKKRPAKDLEQRWTLVRVGYLLVAAVAVWFLLAYVAPSPIGLLIPAIPYVGLILAAVAFFLLYSLWRSRDRRWSAVFRGTVVWGVVLGLVFAGMIGLVSVLAFGCPYLPPAPTVPAVSNAPDWHGGSSLPAWTSDGKPVVYFYGATWCPFCSASSWAIWKALTEFSTTVTGEQTAYSSPTDSYPGTPEMVLENLQLNGNSPIAYQVSEYTGGTDGVAPSTSTCYQLAYVTAYSGGSIPFFVIGGKYVHGGTSLINPEKWKNYTSTGASAVQSGVKGESGYPWQVVQQEVWWIMAFIAKCLGTSTSTLASEFGWSSADQTNVNAYLAEL
ncbi:MAG TPA: DUF929 family protein [Thermoplasmata archaeon]|nr:DUF929 family protein [Thermoplasmata archaeon]